MWEFAANLSMLWPELDVYDRFSAAAAAGFSRIELLFPHLLDPARLQAALRSGGLDMVLFDADPGNWAAGERGLLCLPGRESELRRSVEQAVRLAESLGVDRVNLLAGVVPLNEEPDRCWERAVANLCRVEPLARDAGVVLLIEPLNSHDVPGYLVSTPEHAVRLIKAAGGDGIRLQFDQYHVGMVGDDPIASMARHFPVVGHVQIADVPGRHQPGTGTQPISELLDTLGKLGYDGFVGLEYIPLGTTEESLSWLEERPSWT